MKAIILCLLLSNSAWAEDAPKDTRVYPGGGAEDLLHNTKFSPEQTEKKKNPKIKLSASCAANTGAGYKPGEAGYENCVRDAEEATQNAKPQ